MADITMRQLLEVGAHFGHRTRYWNPKMDPYIFGHRNKVHIINLEHTLPMLRDACNYAGRLAANGGQILFVGTKRAARDVIEQEARRCGMPYINQRWLGGALTNFKTVKASISRLLDMERQVEDGSVHRLPKKEQLEFHRDLAKLQRSLGGIKHMTSLPDCLFVIDTGYEDIAIKEAQKLGIRIVAVVDSNNSPLGIDSVIPGNDDATRAIKFYCECIANAVIDAKHANSVGSRATQDMETVVEKAEPAAQAQPEAPAEPAAEAPKPEASGDQEVSA